MTIKQAEKKICPIIEDATFAMMTHEVKVQSDLDKFTIHGAPANINCCTTSCMAWTISKSTKDIYISKVNTEKINELMKNGYEEQYGKYGKYYGKELPIKKQHGYCKLLK